MPGRVLGFCREPRNASLLPPHILLPMAPRKCRLIVANMQVTLLGHIRIQKPAETAHHYSQPKAEGTGSHPAVPPV